MKRKKYKYLYQLIITILLVLTIPIIFLVQFFWSRSFDEIRRGNEIYYEKVAASFRNGFNDELTDLKDHASLIRVNSKNTDSVFSSGKENFLNNAYWYYEAMTELRDNYPNHAVSEWGIYYYEIDSVITRNCKQFLNQYIYNTLNLRGKSVDNVLHLFSEDNFQMMKMMFCTTNTEEDHDGSLLVGYCTTMGNSNDKVMIFYLIKPSDFAELWDMGYEDEGIYFYVLDKETNQVYLAFGDACSSEMPFMGETQIRSQGVMQKVLYRDDDNFMPLSFVVYTADNYLQNNVMEFYQDMKKLSLTMILLLLFLCCIALYAEYKPVHKLMSEMEDYDGGEFEVIRNALNDRSSKILEQEMMIMDLLVNHLLYGIPVSVERLEKLGAGNRVKHYCVYTLDGHILLTHETAQISAEAEKRFHSRLFVTDLQEEKRNVIIAFLEELNAEEIEKWLTEWFEKHVTSEYYFYSGSVVDSADDIRSSYQICCGKKKEHDTDRYAGKEDRQRKMKEDILAYLEIHYRDEDLNQTQVADFFQISNYTLSRMFKNQVGVGFTEYVNSKRLDYAKELLLTTTYSIREISVMAGFSNDNYFSRIFKATVGESPSVFREG